MTSLRVNKTKYKIQMLQLMIKMRIFNKINDVFIVDIVKNVEEAVKRFRWTSWRFGQSRVSEWVSSFLMAHPHILDYLVPYDGENVINMWRYNRSPVIDKRSTTTGVWIRIENASKVWLRSKMRHTFHRAVSSPVADEERTRPTATVTALMLLTPIWHCWLREGFLIINSRCHLSSLILF